VTAVIAMSSVSVIIPSYNRADYLPQAIGSILAQTYPVTEIIVVDDGSTDDTLNVVQRYQGRVRFYVQNHSGVAAARNKGLELAHGDVIAWCDADDVWETDFLKATVSMLDRNPNLDGVYGGVAHIDSDGQRLPQVNCIAVPPKQLHRALSDECFLQTTAVVLRKKCFDQAGPFDAEFQICEDYDMWLRLSKRFTIVGVPRPLINYRVHSQNTVRDTSKWCQSRLAITRKHFGELNGPPTAQQRRAYAFAYRGAAMKCIQDGAADEGWQYLRQGVTLWPQLLARLDTLYELACGDQPPGQRGAVNQLNLERNRADLLKRLDELFAQSDSTLAVVRAATYGNTYLALGMLSEQAGHWSTARLLLLKALRANPRLGLDLSFMRRLLKVSAGPRVVRKLRKARPA